MFSTDEAVVLKWEWHLPAWIRMDFKKISHLIALEKFSFFSTRTDSHPSTNIWKSGEIFYSLTCSCRKWEVIQNDLSSPHLNGAIAQTSKCFYKNNIPIGLWEKSFFCVTTGVWMFVLLPHWNALWSCHKGGWTGAILTILKNSLLF